MECKYCKAVIEDGVKFCPECGKRAPINESFDARTHRCPYCDTILPSFVQNCPSCGSEIRSEAKVSKVDVFAQKYMQQTTNEQRISLIKTFVIPNTREDILEFVILASTNIDEKVYEKHQTRDEDNLSAEDVSDAWMIKLEQAHQKAHLVLNGDSYLSKIDSIYSQKKNFFTKKDKKEKRDNWLPFAFILIPLLLLVFVPLLFSNSGSSKDDSSLEESIQFVFDSKIAEIEKDISSGNLDSALIKAYALDESQPNWKKAKKSIINRILELQGAAEGKIIIPELPSSINYSDAVTILTQAGFTNVTSEPISKSQGLEHYIDKFENWLNGKKDGEVVEVSVNGKTDYDSETYIPKDAIIVVRYYQKGSK